MSGIIPDFVHTPMLKQKTIQALSLGHAIR